MAKLSAGQQVEHLETIRARKDGTEFPVSITVSPLRDANGAVVVIVADVLLNASLCRDTAGNVLGLYAAAHRVPRHTQEDDRIER